MPEPLSTSTTYCKASFTYYVPSVGGPLESSGQVRLMQVVSGLAVVHGLMSTNKGMSWS